MFKVFVVILAVSALSTSAFAASPWTEETTYGEQAKAKLAFGVKNLLLGWTDLFSEPEQYHADGRNVFAGIGKGMVDLVTNSVGGILHIVTFPITSLDIPLPDNGVQL